MDIQRLIAFMVFSFSALLLWDAWQKHQAPVAAPPSATVSAPAPGSTAPPAALAGATPGGALPSTTLTPPAQAPTAAATTVAGKAVVVSTDLFEVELNTEGGDIRRVTLFKVFSALDAAKPLVLMAPDAKHFFVTQTGLLGEGLPNHKTRYEAQGDRFALAPAQDRVSVVLTAVEAGAEVTKTYTFRRGSYEIEVAYEVANRAGAPLTPFAYSQFLRDSNPPSQEAAQTSPIAGVATFTGPAIYTNEAKFVKVDFSDIEKGKQSHPKKASDGWIALVQHYFVSAWIPQDKVEREYFTNRVGENLYTAGVVVPVGNIAPGATARVTMPLYIGPQETDKLEKIAPGLELVIDYGWLTILAAPLFWVLNTIHGYVGNWGWAIVLLTILIKLVFYPLNHKAGRSMAQMKVLGPKMEKLKQLYGNDRQKLNQAMMELYRTEKINPLGGCLPILVQIPVFIALYWVLLASIELRHAPWIGWIQDLSAPDPWYILPVIYAVSMFVQTKLNPQPADPVQARVMLAMPIVFSIFFFFFPAGLVLYWVVQNLLTIGQQWHINRTIVAETAAKAKGKR
jgi:YidC/Oxa1 family membrane protein insertase